MRRPSLLELVVPAVSALYDIYKLPLSTDDHNTYRGVDVDWQWLRDSRHEAWYATARPDIFATVGVDV